MPPSDTSAAVAVGSVFSQAANCAAACWFLDPAITAVDEPAQVPTTFPPAVHCGSSVIAHLPAPDGAVVGKSPGAQTSETQAMYLPSFIPLFQAAVHCGWLSTPPPATRPCQNEATFWLAASSMPTVQVLPEADHHCAPACCVSPANSPGSTLENEPRNTLGASACSFVASAANCAQVVGTVRPYFVKRSAR